MINKDDIMVEVKPGPYGYADVVATLYLTETVFQGNRMEPIKMLANQATTKLMRRIYGDVLSALSGMSIHSLESARENEVLVTGIRWHVEKEYRGVICGASTVNGPLSGKEKPRNGRIICLGEK